MRKTYYALEQFAKHWQYDMLILHLAPRVLNGMYRHFGW